MHSDTKTYTLINDKICAKPNKEYIFFVVVVVGNKKTNKSTTTKHFFWQSR